MGTVKIKTDADWAGFMRTWPLRQPDDVAHTRAVELSLKYGELKEPEVAGGYYSVGINGISVYFDPATDTVIVRSRAGVRTLFHSVKKQTVKRAAGELWLPALFLNQEDFEKYYAEKRHD